jgi:hypothetical protein
MNSILPWNSPETTLVKKTPSTDLAPKQSNNDILIGRPSGAGAMVQVRSKQVVIGGKRIDIDPYQLIRLIKRVTQNIGEYKDLDDAYSTIVCGALRKARGDLVNILECEFHIHWQVENGKSIFFM